MKPDQFKALQERIGCNGVTLARWLGVSTETVVRWRNGRRPVPGPVRLAMMALASGWRPE